MKKLSINININDIIEHKINKIFILLVNFNLILLSKTFIQNPANNKEEITHNEVLNENIIDFINLIINDSGHAHVRNFII